MLLLKLVIKPREVFEELSDRDPDALIVFLQYLIWFAILPPVFAFIGGSNIHWRLGATEPLVVSTAGLVLVSLCYFLILVFGYVSTAVIARWMAPTYGARESFGVHLMLIAIIAFPMVIGSTVHLYPNVFLNVLVLTPMLIWSMYLLYTGLPVILKISTESGMLMATSLIAYLLVGAVSLLGISVALWVQGIGPSIGV